MTAQQLDIAKSNPALCQLIAQRIIESPQQRITFAAFMELALYHPQHGYYATNRESQGIQSDFFTSPHLGSDFGELLAEQFAQFWELLDRPTPFTLVEMGAGQGLLVQDIVRYLHRHHFQCFESLEYLVIEKSPALVAAQQHRFQKLIDTWGHLHWRTWEELPSNSITGCCFSNELVDALPVHQVVIQSGRLQEIYVTVTTDSSTDVPVTASHSSNEQPVARQPQFEELTADLSTPKLAEYFELINLKLPSKIYPDGYRSEVNLAALDWMNTVSDRLQRGYLLTIDYGYPAHRYYSPIRDRGTLQCYYQHAHHSDPYLAIGRQDITAHVNFTALEQQGEQCGLQTIGFTQQGLFLMALGLGDRLAALSNADPEKPLQTILQHREALHALMNPMGLGNFGVLIQGKGLEGRSQNMAIKGLTTPAML